MRFCSLGSGSAGNASLVEASQGITTSTVLIDCGFSQRELVRRLDRADCRVEDLDAIFVTHEHGDHIGCALGLAQRHRIPLWMSRGTWRALRHRPAAAALDPVLLRLARDGEAIDLGDMTLHPFAVPHDAMEPLQLCATDGRHRMGILTDVGSLTAALIGQLQGCDGLLLEFNHDEDLLRGGSYPANLKRRILGSHGHLSNAVGAEILGHCAHPGLQFIVAAHLSECNNNAELVTRALQAAVENSPTRILIADQVRGLEWQTLE